MRLAGISGVGFRLLNMAVLLLTTPVLVRSLNDASFGMFVTITALTSYLALSDLGVGAGLLTVLGRASGVGDRRLMSRIVVDAGWLMLAAGFVVALAGLGVSIVVDIPGLLGAPPGQESEALAAYRIFVAAFAMGIPLALGGRIQSALQQGAEGAFWLSMTTSLSAAAAAIAARASHSLVVTMVASAGMMVAVSLGQTTSALRQHRWIWAAGLRFRRTEARLLFASSGWLFVLQIAAVIAFQTDLLVVSAILGANQAAVFNGVLRAFSLVSLVTTALASQFWPAAAEALGSSDYEWVRRTHRGLIWRLPVLSALGGCFLIVFGRMLIGWWLGPSLVPPLSALVAFALWTTYSSFVLPYTHLLNAAGILRPQAFLGVLMAAVNLALSVCFTAAVGLAGPTLGSLVAHACVALIPTIVLARGALRRAKDENLEPRV